MNPKKDIRQSSPPATNRVDSPKPQPKATILQGEILGINDSETDSPIGSFDFRNFSYPSPRGWQDADSKQFSLKNGQRELTDEKIGMAYVATKFGDVTGDGQDEAFVILRVKTGGSAIPQIVYIYEWRNKRPELLWYFRTGDRADGGLKRVYEKNGDLVIELFGRDRYIFDQMETKKIVGDEQQLCCPTHFTRNVYKKKGHRFVLEGKRLTYSLEDKNAEPEKNMNEKRLEENRESRQ
ncbi:MAG: hypothetical protein HKN25_03080 [Pyrinomonadaceae bacterium]|nr:hypothetical protein [Pyrinomonadaceae bacterium]